MCLPLGCLTFWITASAVICLILGVVAAIVAGVQSGGYLNEYIPDEFKSLMTGSMYALLAFGILLILIGITGIIAGIKKIKFCSVIYMIGMIIFAIIFIAIGIAALAAAASLGDMRNPQECENQTIYGNWNMLDQTGYETLCTAECPCKLYKDSPLIALSKNLNRSNEAFVYEGVDRPKTNTTAPAPAASANTNTNANANPAPTDASKTTPATKLLNFFSAFNPITFQATGQTEAGANTQAPATGGQAPAPAAGTGTNASTPAKAPELSPIRFQQCPIYKQVFETTPAKVYDVVETDDGLKWTENKNATTPPADKPAANNTTATTTNKPATRFLQTAGGTTGGVSGGADASSKPAAASNATNVTEASKPTPYVAKPVKYQFNDKTRALAVAFWGSLRKLEDIFDCAGVCYKSDFYTFSDINKAETKPIKDSCGGILYDFLKEQGKTIGLVSLLIGLFLLLNFILAICHWKQSSKESG